MAKPDLSEIRRAIEKTGLGQRELSRASHVPQSVISKIVNGQAKRPAAESIIKLCSYLGLLDTGSGLKSAFRVEPKHQTGLEEYLSSPRAKRMSDEERAHLLRSQFPDEYKDASADWWHEYVMLRRKLAREADRKRSS